MQKQEFQSLANIEVTSTIYSLIERAYLCSNLSKQEFVKQVFRSEDRENERTIFDACYRFVVDFYPLDTRLCSVFRLAGDLIFWQNNEFNEELFLLFFQRMCSL